MDVVENQFMKNLLKTVYEEGVVNNKVQGSTLVGDIKKEAWVGGNEIAYSTNYGNGGNVGGSLKALTSAYDSYDGFSPRNAQWKATVGGVSAFFDINPVSINASDEDKKAFMPILENEVSSMFDNMAKATAIYLYGGKNGVIEQLTEGFTANAAGTNTTVTLSHSAGVKLQPGIRFQIASAGADNKAVPSSPYLSPVFTVVKTKANGDKVDVTFKSNSSATATAYVGDYIELYGSRVTDTVNGTEIASGFEGLYDILPAFNDRTGDAWEQYIATEFRGVDRSVAEDALAGQFFKAATTGDTRYQDVLTRALRDTTVYGATNNQIYISPIMFDKLEKEMDSKAYLKQSTNGAAAKRGATMGINDLAIAFKSAFLDKIAIDAFADDTRGYSIDPADLVLKTMEDAGKVFGPVSNGEVGKYEVKGFGDQGISTKQGGDIDKIFQVIPGISAGSYAYNTRIVGHLVGNLMLKKTASSGIILFD